MNLLSIVGIAAAAFVGTKLLLKGDDRVEGRRESAVDLAGWCNANGLPLIGRMLRAYAVGDYGGIMHGLSEAQDLMGNAEARQAAVDAFLNLQLQKQIATTDGREALIRRIEELLALKIDRDSITQLPTEVAAVEEEVVLG